MDRKIRFRHLQVFLEAVRLGSLKAAAEKLELTQPAVTKALNELEEIAEVRLLNRERSGVRLTDEGVVFHQFARNGLDALEEGMSRLEDLRSGSAGKIVIGALPSVAARLLPRVIAQLARMSPGLRIIVEEGGHNILTDKLRAGAVDVVVGRFGSPDTMGSIAFSQLYMERVVLAVRADHPLAGSDRLDLIGEHTVIYPTKHAAIRPLVDRFMRENGHIHVERQIEAVSAAFGRGLVMESDAVWLISEGVVAPDLRAGTLAIMDVDTDLTLGPVGLMVRDDEEMSPTLKLFKTAINQVLAQGDEHLGVFIPKNAKSGYRYEEKYL